MIVPLYHYEIDEVFKNLSLEKITNAYQFFRPNKYSN